MPIKNYDFYYLANEFIIQHNKKDEWSNFDAVESASIRLFAAWLDRIKNINDENN